MKDVVIEGEEKAMVPTFAERRSQFRFPIVLPVEYSRLNNSIISSYSLDISRRGMFISSDQPLEIGSRCRIRLIVPIDRESSRFFEIEGAVTWNKILPFKSKRAGMGIQFFEPLPENVLLNALADTTKKLTRESEVKKQLEEQVEELKQELKEKERLTALGRCLEKIIFELTNPILTLSGTLEVIRVKMYNHKRRLEEHAETNKEELTKIADEFDAYCKTIDRILKDYKIITELEQIAGYKGEDLEKILREKFLS
jgi:Tfp pilus assembly protein PilZ